MSERGEAFLKIFLVGLILLVVASVIILCLVPPVSKDALVHHLAVPKLYLKHGGIFEIPSMPYSYYPMNLDLLYLIALYFGNDIAPKYIHFLFALLTALLIYHYLRRRSGPVYALLGVLFFLSLPIIIKLSITAYVDLGLAFFSTASLLLIMKWMEKGFKIKFLLLSAICCGLGAGIKYNGIIVFVILTLFVPFIYSRYERLEKPSFEKAIGFGALFFFVAILFFSPWMTRNYIWKKNPVYPLYEGLFNQDEGARKFDHEKVSMTAAGHFTYRSLVYKEKWWQIAIIPLRIFFQGKDGNPRYFDGKLNPFILLLLFLAFYKRRREPPLLRKEKKILLAFAVLFFVFAFLSTVMRIRYLSPLIGPIIILSVLGIQRAVTELGGIRKTAAGRLLMFLVITSVSFALVLNFVYILNQFIYVNPFPYISGKIGRSEYISRYRPEYPSIQYVNRNLPEKSLILFVFLGKRGYYCERDYIPDIPKEVGWLYRKIRDCDNSQKFLDELSKRGITHLIVNKRFLNKWINDLFEGNKKKVAEDFFERYLDLLYLNNEVGVFKIPIRLERN